MNWENIIIAFLGSLPAIIASIAVLLKQSNLHKLVNSRMSELLEATRSDASNKATLAEKAAERTRRTTRERNE